MDLSNLHEDKKTPQSEAGYVIPVDKDKLNKITGLFCCGACDNFLPPHGCKGVAGTINKGGCCNFYKSDEVKKP